MTDTSLILWVQQYATPAWTAFFKTVTHLGSLEFYMLGIPLVYWLIDKHVGFRLAIFFTLSAYVNSGTKFVFKTERPPQNLRLLTQEGYSFPSGHAQGSTAFWGFLAWEIKERWAASAAVLMILLISFSRIYLGVHWPLDILGGVSLGLILLVIYNRFRNFNPRNISLTKWTWGSLLFAAFLYLLHPQGDGPMTIGFLLGAFLGYRLELLHVNFREQATALQNILKLVLGLGLLFGLRVALKPVLAPLPEGLAVVSRYTCLGLWASWGAPWLFMKLGLFSQGPFTRGL